MQFATTAKQGTNIVTLGQGDYVPGEFLLRFIEERLQEAGLPVEFINVEDEPSLSGRLHNIRFNIRISGKDW